MLLNWSLYKAGQGSLLANHRSPCVPKIILPQRGTKNTKELTIILPIRAGEKVGVSFCVPLRKSFCVFRGYKLNFLDRQLSGVKGRLTVTGFASELALCQFRHGPVRGPDAGRRIA